MIVDLALCHAGALLHNPTAVHELVVSRDDEHRIDQY